MRQQKKFMALGRLGACVVAAGMPVAFGAPQSLTGVPAANPKNPGIAVPNALTPELIETIAAQGSMRLENGTTDFPFYGYDGDGTLVPLAGALQSPGHNVEATKTEPDKNTYLVLDGQHGPDANYDYGTHFLFQGHELGIKNAVTGNGMGYLTRVNLDADAAHRVTLLAATDNVGNSIPVIDGSTWYPLASQLLFTFEGGTSGGVWQATVDYPSTVVDLSGIFGRGGYEAIQADSDGNLWIVEDSGGSKGTVNKHARQPNSFLFRFTPYDVHDLTAGGVLQALQVQSRANPGQPIVFHAGQADADILAQDVKDLHTYGFTFFTDWVTVHDTAVDGMTPFDANGIAKTMLATPFKRPENGLFRPDGRFRQFVFDTTGDTDATTEAGSTYGGFGAVFVLNQQKGPSSNDGVLTLLFRGDVDHTGLDNCAFASKDEVIFVEDRGDTLHTQHNALDSAFLFDLTADYSNPATPAPVRILALGRDASATVDASLLDAGNGYQNEGDNEITGFHISDGDASVGGILGGKTPKPFKNGWRVFYTQQHGDNVTWEILPAAK